jgi:hypothetical protein
MWDFFIRTGPRGKVYFTSSNYSTIFIAEARSLFAIQAFLLSLLTWKVDGFLPDLGSIFQTSRQLESSHVPEASSYVFPFSIASLLRHFFKLSTLSASHWQLDNVIGDKYSPIMQNERRYRLLLTHDYRMSIWQSFSKRRRTRRFFSYATALGPLAFSCWNRFCWVPLCK